MKLNKTLICVMSATMLLSLPAAAKKGFDSEVTEETQGKSGKPAKDNGNNGTTTTTVTGPKGQLKQGNYDCNACDTEISGPGKSGSGKQN